MKYQYTLLGFTILFMISCNKDIIQEPPCENYVRPTAKIYFDPYLNPTPDNNNLTVQRYLQFRSNFMDTSIYTHTWYLGSETLSIAKFWRDFTGETVPKTYTIYHAMHWQPNKLCDPLDNGYDSTSFTFTITDKYNDLNVLGKYRVAFDSLPYDSIDIELFFAQFDFRDSIVKNPMQSAQNTPYDGGKGSGNTIKLRLKGLNLCYHDGIKRTINEEIEFAIINANYISFVNITGQSSIEGPGQFYLNPFIGKLDLSFYFFNYHYSLKGRKL